MKINNKKIIVPTLTIAMACALVGSIAGSVAWYQYSTRATSFITGTTAGSSRNLQIATELVDDELTNNIDDEHWGYHYTEDAKNEFAPTTIKFNDNDVVDGFVSHPVYQHFDNWIVSDDSNFFSYDLYFQSIDEENHREELDVFLTAFDLRLDGADVAAESMIEKSLRVELVPYTFDGADWNKGQSRILSKDGGTTITSDYLNLNKKDNAIMDHDGFAADDSEGVARKYKAGLSYKAVVLEENEELDNYYLDSALTNPAFSNEYNAVEGDDANTLKLFTDAKLTVAANNFHTVEGHENDPGTDLFLDQECQNPAPNPLTADGTYFKAGVAAGTYYRDYTPFAGTAGVDLGAGLYTDIELQHPAVVNSDGKLNASGDYFKKNLADGLTTYYIYNDLSDSYESIAYDTILNSDDNPYQFDNKGVENANALIKTSGEYAVKLTVKVWLEGWQQGNSVSETLTLGQDGTGYYSDSACTTPATNSHQVVKVDGDSEEGLFQDAALTTPAVGKHLHHAAEGENGAEYYTDEAMTIHATNYLAVESHVGDDPNGLYQDTACTIPVVQNPEHKVAYDGTYYKVGVAAGDYYVAGVAAGTYYAEGVEAGNYYSKGYIWDANTIGTKFNLGLRFGVEADK